MGWLLIVMEGLMLYSAGCGVNRVTVHLSGFNLRWLASVQLCMASRYGWSCLVAVVMDWCDE